MDRRVVFVHAHPDDEALSTGGTIAAYASSGAHVCLVTCTNGELGEMAEEVSVSRENLGKQRTQELRESCRILEVSDLRMLGYRDSGMDGTDGNHDPSSFVNQDPDEVVARIVAVYRDVRPQVVVTYDEYGFYGHPDHIRAHQAAVAALDSAADPGHRPDLGPPHRVERLYYTAVPKSALRAFRDVLSERGIDTSEFLDDDQVERIGTDDDRVTTTLDVSRWVDAKYEALKAHRSQLGTTAPFLSLDPQLRSAVFGTEHYVRVRPPLLGDGTESDLFEGMDL